MWFVSEGVNQISLAQSGIQWMVVVNKKMNLDFLTEGNILQLPSSGICSSAWYLVNGY
jgi:hypothetical protein